MDKKWKVKIKGKVYEPRDTETIKKWIKEKRIPSDAEIFESGVWQKITEKKEFMNFFTTALKRGMRCPKCIDKNMVSILTRQGVEIDWFQP